MKSFRSVTVAPVRSLEVGDLIAMEFVGGVISGELTGVATFRKDLTEAQIQYMLENKLNVPDEPYAYLGGQGSRLLFGNFHDTFLRDKHMFVDDDVNVAVFPTKKESKSN